jgi:hypothetical protein
MELLHTQCDQVLACNTDSFLGDTPENLTHFLDTLTAAHIQNWLHVWKSFILSSVKVKAKYLSSQGIRTMTTTYFTPTVATPL